MTYLYLDIETLPTTDTAIIADIAASIKPPANYKSADTIAKWEAETKADAVREAVAKTGLSGLYGSICCICFTVDGEDIVSSHGEYERDVLSNFIGGLEFGFKTPTIVGHNVAEFDIRFIRQRCIVNGIKLPSWWPVDPKPWSRDVFDTMHAWGGAKNYVSLDKLCRVLGIPGKSGFDGSMVADEWFNGDRQKVVDYCADDVERTRAVHRRMMIASGELA